MNKKIFSDVKVLTIISAAAIVFSLSVLMIPDSSEAENLVFDDGVLKAVIIDQLYDDSPRDWFHLKASEMLEASGYEVDIFTTQDITLDFYKKLPSMNYDYIIIRTHSIDNEDKNFVALFTGERYQEDKYISEQLFGHVVRGAPLQTVTYQVEEDSSEWIVVNATFREMTTSANITVENDDDYFLITPKLVNELMDGKFPGSTFVIGGCSSLKNESLAKSLVDRGASSIIGWDDVIGDMENDIIMLEFLKETLVNKMEINDAIDLIMERYDWGSPDYDAVLKYYPESNL